ncbi:MAG: aldehyde dehydrogenase family protein [Pseudomonadota bacterium]
MSWTEKAASLNFDTRPFVAGDFLPDQSDLQFETSNPATAQSLARFVDAGDAQVDAAVSAARKAFTIWSRMSPIERKRLLLAFAEAMRQHSEQLALRDSLEMGKPISMALGEAMGAADFVQYYAELADKIGGEVSPIEIANGLSLTYYEPRGVVGIITPWNFPVFTAVTAIAPALAAGNTVVQKPSEVSPSSAILLAKLAVEVGIPPGVLNVVTGTGQRAGAALARHGDVDKLHFTGSTAVGKQLMIYAGQSNGKPVMLETGGKSPQIVFEDAVDIDGLGQALAADVFSNTGQICVARTRLLVHESISDQVTALIEAGAKAFFQTGDPLDESVNYGPICNEKQFTRVSSYLELATQEGATTRTAAPAGSPLPGGYFVEPTIVVNASMEMRVAREEIFGPVRSVLTFSSYEEAIALANATEYGLAATAWTRDMGRAHRLSHDLDAGRVDIRSSTAAGASLAHLTAEPFGGSGHGALGGTKGLEPYLRFKGVQFLSG